MYSIIEAFDWDFVDMRLPDNLIYPAANYKSIYDLSISTRARSADDEYLNRLTE